MEETPDEGHWEMDTVYILPSDGTLRYDILKTIDSFEYGGTEIRRSVTINNSETFYRIHFIWNIPKKYICLTKKFSLTCVLIIWGLIDPDKSGYVAAFFTPEITLYSNVDTLFSGTFGPGVKGDTKKIEIRFAYPELGGINYYFIYKD